MGILNAAFLSNKTRDSYWRTIAVFNLTTEQVEKLGKVIKVKETAQCSAANAKAVLIKAAVGTTGKVAFSLYWMNKAAEHPEWNIKASVKETLLVSSEDILKYVAELENKKNDSLNSLDF